MTTPEYTLDTDRAIVGNLASFRTVALVVSGLVVVWIALSIVHYFDAREQIRNLLSGQAESLAATMALADWQTSLVLEQLEEEQAQRLQAIGMWLRERDAASPLTMEDLENIAESANVFNINVFDKDGQRETGLRGHGPPIHAGGRGMGGGAGRRGGGGGGGQHGQIQAFLESRESIQVSGLHKARYSDAIRLAVLIRRTNGGVISLNIDATEQSQLRQNNGPAAYLRAMSERPEIFYVERRIDGERDLFFGEEYEGLESPDHPEVIELEVDIPNQNSATLLIGFDAGSLRTAERELKQRLLWSAFFALALGIAGLVWMRFQKRHGLLARALQQVRSYHRVLLEQMGDAVISWEENGGLTFWNDRAEGLFPELTSCSVESPLPESVLTVFKEIDASNQTTILTLEEHKTGPRRFRAETETIETPQRTQVLFLSDITAVEEATSEKNHREHLEALAQVASGVAHEVRNPLNAIDMTIQTLCMEPSTLQEDDRQTLEQLRSEIARINGIVTHFLAYGRPQPPAFSPVDLSHVMAEVATFLKPVAEENHVTLEFKSPEIPEISADPQHIRQAVINIALNAIEASEQGSKVELQIEKNESEIICRCVDHGCGMTEEQRVRLFDPFITSKVRGTGLGMSIVKQIVRSHNGSISVQSEPGKGTEINLHFPLQSIRDKKETND